ncbi:serine hydrolase [Primorskyibacter aestuariivivens]|uniref:serine hydrolase domain-containing protein n=1 Tax=Primorskyibacter aestuariivivens TaxID=1888912 RepID=UPI002300019D|nr:serine hydrolase [Primorskyibacter aestuariivivens]MDA7428048.1 serine hydrolase [Primorskyibacter aestuariivivens]
MPGWIKWSLRVTLVLGLAIAAVAFVKREEITRLLAVNTLFDADRIVANFSNMDRLFLHRPVPRGNGRVSALPHGPEMALPDGTMGWIKTRAVTALVVLHNGQIVHESYYQGTTAEDRRISWSMAKSYLSMLFGLVLADGDIAALDDPVTKYAPALKGGAYDGASILNVLQMTSGVEFDEDYLDYNSDINRMGRVLALGGTMDGFAAGLTETEATPGGNWAYTSIDTHVLGMVIRGATGRDIADLLSERIIKPMGLEAEPYYLTDGEGVAFVLGGLNLTTRDYARMGLMVAQDGRLNGQQIVPADWIAASTAPSAPTKPGKLGYGYQWWIPKGASEGEVMARGIYGQYVYIDRARDVVIAVNAADRQFRDDGVDDQNVEMFRRIATSLKN